MRKQKWIVFLMVMIMGITSLTGCGGNGTAAGKKGDGKEILIKYWNSGLKEEWLNAVVEGFEKAHPEYTVKIESSSSSKTITSTFGLSDVDTTDLYLCTKQYNTKEMLEPLDDVLDSKANGESVTIREKFKDSYLTLETEGDGHVYNLTYGGGIVGIFYNEKMFEENGIKQTPRTTKELLSVCDILNSADIPAFCHFKSIGYWEDYMIPVLFTQYDGLDYVVNNFFGCTDEQGNSPSKNVFTKQDGRYEALKVLESVITPEYTMEGSNSYDHTTVQTMWLQEEACMMVNGTWISSEMTSVSNMEGFALMKTPVISSIIDKLTTVTKDSELQKVVSAIDRVTDGEAELSEYQQGNDYVVDGLTVSADDWECIKAARNTMALNATGNSAYIPTYSDNKEGAKEFLRYLYSDEGYKIYASTLQQTMPLSLSEGELDMSKWSAIAQQQAKIFETTEQFISIYNASAHDIFKYGGASWKGDVRNYCNRFCSRSDADRWTAEQVWEQILQNVNDNYENTWLANMK